MRVAYIILVLSTISLYMFFGDYTYFILLCVVAIIPAFTFLINLIASKKIKVDVKLVNKIVLNSDDAVSKLELTFDNESIFPSPFARLYIKTKNRFTNETFDESIILPIVADNVTQLITQIKSDHCGRIEISVDKIKIYDILSITCITKQLNIKDLFVVMPISAHVDIPLSTDMVYDNESYEYSTIKSGDDSSQVFDYSEYTQGDRMKNINWKLSSKLDKIMVKRPSLPVSSSTRVLLELNCNNLSEIDAVLEASMSLFECLNQNGISFKLSWFNTDHSSMASHVFDANQHNFEEALYTAFEQIYDLSIYTTPRLLNDYIEQRHGNKYSNLLYITSNPDQNSLEKIESISSNIGVSVILVCEADNTDKSKALSDLLAEKGIDFIKLVKSKPKEKKVRKQY